MKKRTALCLLLCLVLLWFLADAREIRAAATDALTLCARSVIPALFPFLVVSSLLVSLGFGEWLSPRLRGLMALYRLPGHGATALLLGAAAGYPVGVRTAADLYRRGMLTEAEARRLLTFCNNSNPVFLISVLGVGVFGSVRAGVWLWLIHLLSALIVGLFFRGGRRADRRPVSPPPLSQPTAPARAFVEAVTSSAAAMVSVCAFVIFFYVLAKPLSALGGYWSPLLTGFLELFSLTPLLPPDRMGFLLAAGLSGWGGLSVMAQTAAALEGSGLPLAPCLIGKLLQGLLSALLAALAAPLLFP